MTSPMICQDLDYATTFRFFILLHVVVDGEISIVFAPKVAQNLTNVKLRILK